MEAFSVILRPELVRLNTPLSATPGCQADPNLSTAARAVALRCILLVENRLKAMQPNQGWSVSVVAPRDESRGLGFSMRIIRSIPTAEVFMIDPWDGASADDIVSAVTGRDRDKYRIGG